MLRKLLKYDLKSTYIKQLMVLVLSAIIGILIPNFLTFAIKSRDAAIFCTALVVPLAMFATFIIPFFMLFQRYNHNFYGNEGYLMHTLPTSGKKLLASKLLTAFIWITLAIGLSYASYYSAYNIILNMFEIDFSEVLKIAVTIKGINVFDKARIPLLIIDYIFNTSMLLLEIYFAISVAKLEIWRKFGVLMGIVTFFAVELITDVPNWIYSAITDAASDEQTFELFGKIPAYVSELINIPTHAVACVALFFATAYLLDRKTSLK